MLLLSLDKLSSLPLASIGRFFGTFAGYGCFCFFLLTAVLLAALAVVLLMRFPRVLFVLCLLCSLCLPCLPCVPCVLCFRGAGLCRFWGGEPRDPSVRAVSLL